MAQKVVTQLVDDIDGTEIADGKGETVTFGLDGVTYEIDLSDKNAQKLRAAIKQYADSGRRVSGGRGRPAGSSSRRSSNKDYDTAAVKAWAASNNVDVPARGRIPNSVIEQFKAAGN